MQVVKLLHELSARSLSEMHQSRREALWAGVGGVLRGGQASLTQIGRLELPRFRGRFTAWDQAAC